MKRCDKCKMTFEDSEDEHVMNYHIEDAGIKDKIIEFIEKYITEVDDAEI